MIYQPRAEYLELVANADAGWAKVLVPALVSAGISGLVVYFVYKMTIRKEKEERKSKIERARSMEPGLRALINELLIEASKVESIEQLNNLYTGIKAAVNFAEFGSPEVHQFDLENFPRYQRLIRVAYQFRASPEEFFTDSSVWARQDRNLMASSVAVRIPRAINNSLNDYDTYKGEKTKESAGALPISP